MSWWTMNVSNESLLPYSSIPPAFYCTDFTAGWGLDSLIYYKLYVLPMFFVKLKRIEVGRLAKILYSFKSQPIWLCIYKKEILTNISWWMKFPSLIWISFACVIFKFQYLSWLINFTSTGRWFNFWGSRAGLVNSVHYRMFDLFHLLRYVAILILLFKVWSTPWSYVYIL